MTALPHNTGNPPADQPEQDSNWRPLGDMIAALRAEVNAVIRARDELAALESHEALVRAEHEQRVIEDVRRLYE
jgi:hypothetical protein